MRFWDWSPGGSVARTKKVITPLEPSRRAADKLPLVVPVTGQVHGYVCADDHG